MAAARTPHGFGDDAESRALRRRPPNQAIQWVERELGGMVGRVRACRGGSSSAVHVLTVGTGGREQTVVLRRYVRRRVLEEEPDIVVREARVLGLLHRCEVPTPEVLGVDGSGDGAGTPAVLMTHLPGRLDWAPRDLGSWLHRLAEVLPAVHAARIGTVDGVRAFAPYEPASWDPPAWFRDRRLWERGLAVFHGPRLDSEQVLIHRDYHPGNVLWRRGRVTGVIDWPDASIGPRAADVWHCRGNLLGHFDREVADRFLRIWQSLTGADYHPWTEAVMLIDAIGWLEDWRPQVREDLEGLLAERLAELGA